MRAIAVFVVLSALGSTPLAAQDLPSGGITQSWTSSQLLLNSEKEAWAAPECVRPGQWAVDCDGRSPPARQAGGSAALRFTPSAAVRRRNFAQFVEKTRAADPAGAAQLEAQLAGQDLIEVVGQAIAPFDLRTDNVADAMALYLMEAWEAVTGEVLPPDRGRAQAVKRQVERAASGLPALARASDAEKQELAEAFLIQAVLVGASAEAARGGGGVQAREVSEAVSQGVMASTGLDLRAMTLTNQGLLMRTAQAAGPRTPSPPSAAGGGAAPAGASDEALKAALAAVPAEARPVDVVLNGSGGYVGWPPSYVYSVTTYLLFGNGWATTCSDWDPGKLRPTPESLGAAYPDCGLRRWRGKGSGVELQDEDGSWSAPNGLRGELRAFKPGERLDLAFGNVGGIGFAGAPGAVSTNTLSGSDLRMTSGGEIAVGSWSSVVVSGGGVGGGANRRSGSAVGRYRLDGNLVAIADPSGGVRLGFIAGTPAAGRLEHLYLNGRHFWNGDD